MRAVLQRVSKATVTINKADAKGIGQGLVVLVGFCAEDTKKEVEFFSDKIVNLRIFSDEKDAMNLSLLDIQGEILAVSNFTLYADCRRGRRPSFSGAAPPEHANSLYDYFLECIEKNGRPLVTGEFGAAMEIELVNDGPVTILLDSEEICPRKDV